MFDQTWCLYGKTRHKYAYHSIPIIGKHRKLLKLKHKTFFSKFTTLSNGHIERQKNFTENLKSSLATIRKRKITVVCYFHDLITLIKAKQVCFTIISTTAKIFFSLGLAMHLDKSTLNPTHIIEYLGFLIDSSNMTVSLTDNKNKTVLEICEVDLQQQAREAIRFLTKLLGKFFSIFIAVPLGKLH